jgi:hypothetical protein
LRGPRRRTHGLAAIGWRARSGSRSARELGWLDIGCVLLPFTFAALVLWHAVPLVRPNSIHVLGTGQVLVLRGVLGRARDVARRRSGSPSASPS